MSIIIQVSDSIYEILKTKQENQKSHMFIEEVVQKIEGYF